MDDAMYLELGLTVIGCAFGLAVLVVVFLIARTRSDNVAVPTTQPQKPKVYPKRRRRKFGGVSIFQMTDEDLQEKFGGAWQIAREEIENKRSMIQSGHETDWDIVRETWDADEPPTDAQDAILISRGIEGVQTKYEASFVLDELFLRDAVRRTQERMAEDAKRIERVMAQEEKRRTKAAEKEFRQRQKEEVALRMLAEEMADPDYKPRRLKAKKSKDLLEFQSLVNSVVEDNVITIEEIGAVRQWLLTHKLVEGDFSGMLATIDRALADGRIDEAETGALYEGMLDCIIVLRRRP